ncbi:MAG: cytochrome P450, partial [Mycobacterium sp.]
MTASATTEAHFDPYDVELNADPYPMFRRLREESPLYYNEQYDFYALSRFADVNKALVDHDTFSSARGAILELIKANIDIPLIGSGRFDFVADLGAQMPMKVISMLLGIPESDQEAVRDRANNQ